MDRKSVGSETDGGYAFDRPVVGKLSNQTNVSVSLRFYAPSVECFSEWTAADLKSFSSLVSKLRHLDIQELRGNANLCKSHAKGSKIRNYRRPDGIGNDVKFHELKLSGRLRVHGVFQGPVFHLVWLDRNHQVFPNG